MMGSHKSPRKRGANVSEQSTHPSPRVKHCAPDSVRPTPAACGRQRWDDQIHGASCNNQQQHWEPESPGLGAARTGPTFVGIRSSTAGTTSSKYVVSLIRQPVEPHCPFSAEAARPVVEGRCPRSGNGIHSQHNRHNRAPQTVPPAWRTRGLAGHCLT